MNKFFKYLIINIIIFSVLLFIIELSIWFIENNKLQNDTNSPELVHNIKFHPTTKAFILNENNFPNPETGYGRAPDGIEYNKKPIVIFGCSFAYGYQLNKNQTLSYKLAESTKRPVYNRAMTGWGIQHMLYQTRNKALYKQIPEPEYVIYIYMDDHIRRLYLLTFSSLEMLNEYFYLHYKEKNGNLVEVKQQNFILKSIKRLYLSNKIYGFFINHFIMRKNNYKNRYNFAFKHFSESKKEMQKHWKNTKYVVYFYNNCNNAEYLKDKLKNDGFIVLDSEELTNENLWSEKYSMKNFHPKEDAWNLLTPLIIKELNIN